MTQLFLLIPVAVAALWFVQRYREGAFRRARRPAVPAPAPARAGTPAGAAPAATGESGWVFRPEDYGLVPDDQLDNELPGPDPQLVSALQAASAGHWRPAAALLTGSDPQWRWIRLGKLASAAAKDDSWVRAWRAAQPTDPGAALVAAVSLVELAWELRGHKRAEFTEREQFEGFHRVLAQAPSAFTEAARLAPADPSPYIGLMFVARGLAWPHEQMHALWREVTARDPHHVGAHIAALQYWCAKWQGSHELMYAFAEQAAANAPAGSLLPMLRLEARYEELLGNRSNHPGYHTAETTAAIDALLADVESAPPGHAYLPAARHLLVWFLWAQRRLPEAERQLRLVDGYLGALPWRYNADPAALYKAVRDHIMITTQGLRKTSPERPASTPDPS